MTLSLNLFDWFILYVHFIMGSWAPAGSRNCALGANHGYPAGRAERGLEATIALQLAQCRAHCMVLPVYMVGVGWVGGGCEAAK